MTGTPPSGDSAPGTTLSAGDGPASEPTPTPVARVDGWLAELGLVPVERAERDGVASWDLLLDGRRRFDVRLTLILDPALALVGWVHYAPPLNDSFRKSYRQFLKWNDELPFAKFALSADERPVLTGEVPADRLDRDAVGVLVARLLAICDLLLAESAHWLWPGGRRPKEIPRASRHEALIERYAAQLGELADPPPAGAGDPEPPGGADPRRAGAADTEDDPQDRDV